MNEETPGIVFVGVRHHSPACARVVAAVIAREKPDTVLIEGPVDFNDRIDLFALSHTPPLALFAYVAPHVQDSVQDASLQDAEELPSDTESEARDFGAERVRPQASFYPFAAHSPEWVAIQEGLACGARVRFIDLPSYRTGGDHVRSGFHDGPLPASAQIGALAQKLGFDDFDALWDHLFEANSGALDSALEANLTAFFDAFRGDERAEDYALPFGEAARESFMTACILHEYARTPAREKATARVVVVTGGFHTPALRNAVAQRLKSTAEPEAFEEPVPPPPPPDARVGIDLVPYSFARLDALQGYASGMPGPGFYARIWEQGPTRGGEEALFAIVKALRAAKVAIAPADVIALATTAEGLRRMRAHHTLSRSDLLDAVRVVLIKEEVLAVRENNALTRGKGAHPILAVVDELFRGDRQGRVDPATPRPPLLRAVDEELQELELVLGAQEIEVVIDETRPRDRARAILLQRLRLLKVPGISWTPPRLRKSGAARAERFRASRTTGFEPALLEASAYGASLSAAAAAYLEESAAGFSGAEVCARAVADAVRADLPFTHARLLQRLRAAFAAESDLGDLGAALGRLGDVVRSLRAVAQQGLRADANAPADALAAILAAGAARALWLFEAARLPPPIPGSHEPPAAPPVPRRTLLAVATLRDTLALLDEFGSRSDAVGAETELLERYVQDAQGLPALRGAALGWLAEQWATNARENAGDGPSEEALLLALRPLLAPKTIGDVLSGLFAVGREALRRVPALVGLLDELLGPLADEVFLEALPALRSAFGGLTPRERRSFAEVVVARSKNTGANLAHTGVLLAPVVAEEELLRGLRHEAEIIARLEKYALLSDARAEFAGDREAPRRSEP